MPVGDGNPEILQVQGFLAPADARPLLPGPLRPNLLNLSTAERLALLKLARAQAPVQASATLSPIEPVDRGGPLPLSFAQQRLWFLEQLGSAGPAYRISTRLRLKGALDREALVRALDRIVARHEALRTTFHAVDGAPVQRIEPVEQSRFHLREHDLSGDAAPEAELRRVMAEEAGAPFDLARGPLIRGRLVRRAQDDHVLLVTMHHIVSDGWSMGVFTRELGALYGAFQRGESDPLPPLPVQYADYAAWQRRWVEGEVLRAQAEYWKTTLGGAPELLELPTDHPRPARQDYDGASVGVELDAALGAGLAALSQRHGTTLFMTLLAAWAVVLSRLSGQEDVVIGSPMAGRGRREIEGLIGFFVNTLAIRVDVSGAPTVAGLLERVRERALGAQHHQDIPFEQVVELVQPVRSLAHTPLFQVMFAWQNTPRGGGVSLPGLEVGGVGAGSSRVQAQFDLSLSLRAAGDRIVGDVTYATALFERAAVERYVGYLRRVVEEMVADERKRVDRLPLLPQAERRQVVEEWNATARAYPRDRTLHELFAERAALTPEAPAAVAHDGTLSWARLEARAASLAALLRAGGIGPESCVGVCLERSADAAVALLAVLRAGGVWLPLDPDYPRERMGWMLRDAGARLVLAHARTAARLPDDAPPTLRMDSGWEALAPPPLALGESGAGPDNLAYVIYTSGSTGRPKGVGVSHRAAVNFATDMAERLGLGPADRVLQFASPGFDVVVEEIFPAWLAGAAVVFPDADLLSPRGLAAEIARRGVSAVELPTAYWHEWVREMAAGELEVPASLAQVWVGGERISPERLREWTSAGVALVHVFGLTETACTSATLRLEPGEDGSRWANLPIGRPTGNARLYVLDAAMQPVPVGVPGELYVGGEGVARGYLGRPELTAERFVPDPFSPGAGARLYRTGDRARWVGGGLLEFIGRIDHQVKIRGFRIEPGEVEARLREHPAVREAAVLVREDAPGEKRLVAYVAGEDTAGADVLRAHLGERLPEYMVPVAFVRLERLPLTPHGKLDRGALPAPEGEAFARRGYEAPAGEVERVLAEVWAEVLGVERVGRRDHFFEMGGHSLLAVQVISRVRQALAVETAIGDLFARPVLAEFARGLETASRAALPAIVPADGADRGALSFAQQRLWFLDRMGDAGAAYHIPSRMRLKGELDRDALVRALDRIVARHEALRTTFAETDGIPSQRIAPADTPFHLVEHDLRGAAGAGAELRRLTAEEAGAPFDLARGPLIRGRLIRIGDDDRVLLVTMHHIVSDGWSMGVFTRELSALYAAFREGRPDPLPPLPVQYADYAAWQRRWVDGEVLREQADYWTGTLSGAPGLLELPTDHARPARQDFAGEVIAVELDEALTAGLKGLGGRHGSTPFMTVLAGWAAVLGRLSGQEDVVVGTPTANRGRREIEGLIGFFVNTLALRVDLSGSPTAAELLGRVRERALGAQHHQDIPFEQVVERVQPARSLSHTPLFQAMFSWQNAPERELELPGLEAPAAAPGPASAAQSRPAPQATAKFDLSLSLSERGGRIAGSLTYATALFERATVERFAGYLRRALEAMAADEHQAVDRLPLLPEAERRLVLEAWNATGRPYPAGACVHDLFRAQAARTPEAVALSWQGERLTYAELEARANRLARALRRRGVGPEVRVGICLPRTPDLVAAMLGVLGAGGAYVPLDPAYPRERLGYMLEDAGITLVITDSAFADRLPHGAAARLLLDRERDALAAESPDAPESGAVPGNLSHVIFTSGSTGRPKGVMIRHSSVVVLLHWLRENVTEAERSSVLFSTSINFDVSVAEVFGTLCWGGKLVLVENALELATLAEEVVHVSMVPSAAAELLGSGGIPSSVKTLNLGGEALPNALAQGLYALETVEKVGNLYGPTEDTTYSTYSLVPRGAEQVRVGTPVANTQAYVLDDHLQPVPAGVVGELYLAGDGLSRGYANRPAMTAERFVPCPFGAPGARMYRVMDRVRWRESAEVGECVRAGVDSVPTDSRTGALTHSRTAVLEYLGRTDFQVKVRGYRIEPGEIEARLAEHPGVRAPVVLVREDAPGDRRLVAYYLADGPAAVDALKAHLADRLPRYMVPAAYVWMQAYPQTPNGKLDRRALPAPEGDAYGAREYEAPVGETEQALAGIWAEVLGIGRVGRHDDFFALGGHSLLAVQVVSRVRQVLEVEVPLAHLFSHPTVESLAARLRGSEPRAGDDRAIAIRPAGSKPPLFLVHDGRGSTAYARVLHPHIDGDIPVYALPAPPPDPPLRTLEGMATRLVRMIREVQPSGPYRVAGWSLGGVLAYEIATQLIGRDEIVGFVGMLDSYAPALSSNGPDDAAHEHALLQRAIRAYSPQPIPAPVHLFPARQGGHPDPSLGWRALLPGGALQVTPVAGTHLSMLASPNAQSLGGALSERIGQAREDGRTGPGTGFSPILKLQGGKAGVAPLFCVPGAGTSVTSFIDLMGCLDRSWPLHGLQPRGMDGTTVPHSTVAAAAEYYLHAIREECPEGPLHLLGHSFGGWVAFEMALRLREAGRPVGSLTILDSEVPEAEARSNDYDGSEAFLKLVEILELSAERSFGIVSAEAASRDEAGRLELLHQKMVQYGLLTARSTYQVLFGPFRTFARCLRTTYRPPGVYPDRLRLVLVDDPGKDEAANREQFAEAVRGWTRWAPGLVFSAGAGNHITTLKSPHVATLAGYLAEDRG